MTADVAVIGNRKAPSVTDALRAATSGSIVELEASDAASTRRAVADTLANGIRRVVAIGGDGLVHDVIQELAQTDVVLGVVALGTGNDFARALGLPIDDPVAAARKALEPAQPIDLIRCEYGWVATVACAGFPARVNERANRMRFPRGASKYTMATLALLPRLRPDRLSLQFGDAPPSEHSLTLLAAGNTSHFGGGMAICPDADPADAMIDVTMVEPLGRLALLRFLPTVFSGRHRTNPRCRFERCRSLRIDGDVDIWGDGEPLGPAPVTLTAVPAALHVAGVQR